MAHPPTADAPGPRSLAAEALAQAGGFDERLFSAAVEEFDSPFRFERDAAVRLVASMGKDAVPRLRAVADGLDPRARAVCERLLRKLEPGKR